MAGATTADGDEENEHANGASARLVARSAPRPTPPASVIAPAHFYGASAAASLTLGVSRAATQSARAAAVEAAATRKRARHEALAQWRCFAGQDAALAFARHEPAQRVWARELSSSGARHFLVASAGAFWRAYRCMRPDERRHYEVITPDTPCRVYFDLEFDRAANPPSGAAPGGASSAGSARWPCDEARMRAFWALLGEHARATLGPGVFVDGCASVELDSSTPRKFSRHVIVTLRAVPQAGAVAGADARIEAGAGAEEEEEEDAWGMLSAGPEVLFEDNAHAGRWVGSWLAWLEALAAGAACARGCACGALGAGDTCAERRRLRSLAALLAVRPPSAPAECPSPPPACWLVDPAVYSRHRCLRLFKSAKFGKGGAQLLPAHLSEGQLWRMPHAAEAALFERALVCPHARLEWAAAAPAGPPPGPLPGPAPAVGPAQPAPVAPFPLPAAAASAVALAEGGASGGDDDGSEVALVGADPGVGVRAYTRRLAAPRAELAYLVLRVPPAPGCRAGADAARDRAPLPAADGAAGLAAAPPRLVPPSLADERGDAVLEAVRCWAARAWAAKSCAPCTLAPPRLVAGARAEARGAVCGAGGAARRGGVRLVMGVEGSRWCGRIGRHHRSNGVYLTLALEPRTPAAAAAEAEAAAGAAGCSRAEQDAAAAAPAVGRALVPLPARATLSQRCHDPECRAAGYRGDELPLPPALTHALWEALALPPAPALMCQGPGPPGAGVTAAHGPQPALHN